MRLVIQTVRDANVLINKTENASIKNGLLILVGFTSDDTIEKNDKVIHKLEGLRIFEDGNGKINLSVKDIDGELLVVSNFTLYATIKKGFRPSFDYALNSNDAVILYDDFIQKLRAIFGERLKTGKFGADMEITSTNIGPKTFIYEV